MRAGRWCARCGDNVKQFAVLAVLATLFLSSLAHADPRIGKDRTQFIDMGAVVIEGDVKKPTALVLDTHTRPKWKLLFSLKKSMRPALAVTEKDSALR